MSQVAFNTIPGALRVPLFYAEINSGGSPFQATPRMLLLAQKLAGGSATANQVFGPIQSEAEAIEKFGVGSMLVAMYKIARANAPLQPIWAMPLADPAGAAATGTISINAGTAIGVTGAGVLRILGRKIAVQVNAADAAATTAAAIVAAINAAGLPISAAVDGANTYQVNLTTRHVGALGNGLDVSIKGNEPNVLTSSNCTIVALAGGSGVPTITTALTNLGDDEYDVITAPYADATTLDAIKAFLNGTSGRWSPAKQIYGHYFSTLYGTLSACVTLTNARNDAHATVLCSQVLPTPQWETATALAGVAALHLSNGPPEVSRPLQNLVLDGVLPPDDRSKWWAQVDRAALYADGAAACRVSADGDMVLDRVCTTYQQTTAGAPDTTFLDVESMFQLMYGVRFLRTAVLNRHSRQALADENPHNNKAIATPASIRATFIHAYADLVALGVYENLDTFAQFLIVERNGTDANRVDVFMPIDLVNQLRILAVNETAYLQFQTASGAVAIA